MKQWNCKRIEIWKNVVNEKLNEQELMENEPELYQDYANIVTYREFTIQ